MAYKNLVLQTCTDKKELFCRFRDFICARNGTYDYSTTGIGWTLHDSSYAVDEDNPQVNDWIVVYSPGEGSKDDLYFQIKWTSGFIYLTGYLYWNASTHAGTKAYGLASAWYMADTGSYGLSVYGDLNFILGIETENYTNDTCMHFGMLDEGMYDSNIATCASSLSSGSDISITVDSAPTEWEVGKRIYIRDNGNIEIITIKTLDGNTITADLTYAYAAGCKLQSDVRAYLSISNSNPLSVKAMVGHSTTTSLTCMGQAIPSLTSVDPDLLNNDYAMSPYFIIGANTYMGPLPHLFTLGIVGLTEHDVLTFSSTSYRYYNLYSNKIFAVEEV